MLQPFVALNKLNNVFKVTQKYFESILEKIASRVSCITITVTLIDFELLRWLLSVKFTAINFNAAFVLEYRI